MTRVVCYFAAGAIAMLLIAAAWWRWGSVDAGSISPPLHVTTKQPELRKSSEDPSQQLVLHPWFRTRVDVGIHFRHDSGTSPEKPFPAANGSGIAALDYDLDGLWDLYFATGTQFPIDLSRTKPTNQFYRNRGSWQFQDVTEETGLGHNGYSAGVTFGDYNADGFPDVFVACYGPDILFQNMGDGTFVALGPDSGTRDDRWGTSAAMFDYDGDGLLDIYVCNYGKWTLETNRWCGDQSRNVRYYCSPKSIEPEIGALLHNCGDGTFEDTTKAAGLGERLGRAQGIIATDLNGDNAIDVYIGNDLNANSLFMNDGNGHFQDVTETSGAGYDYQGTMQAGMGVDAADANGDGRPELIVTNFDAEANAYYENAGNNLFQEVSQQRGLFAESLPWVGWGTSFTDFDLDGWLDLVVTNGHVDDNRPNTSYSEPPLFWKNERGRFAFIGKQAGEYFAANHVGRALVVADLDNDGDQDIVIGHQDSPPALLENTRRSAEDRQRKSISLRLIGTICNRDAIGSTVTLRNGEWGQVLQVKAGGSYLSAHDRRLVFAIPHPQRPLEIGITWADGSRSTHQALAADHSYVIVQSSLSPADSPAFCAGELK